MNIYAQQGSKVKFVHPTAGMSHDQEEARENLTLGATYTVDYTEVHSWYTRVYLVEVPNKDFNSVLFEDA